MSVGLATSTELLYFGKVPSRGDFIRSAALGQLIQSLDTWQSQTMDRLATHPRWKLIYDAAPPLHFAVLGTASKVGLAGQWLPSQDASGRRFPFITAAAFDLDAPRIFATLAPVAMGRLWARLEQVAKQTQSAADLSDVQPLLNTPLMVDVVPEAAERAVTDFLDTHTVASLGQMLAASGHRLTLRQSVLALGILLQPAMTQGAERLQKALLLPVVQDPAMRGVVASFWLLLVMGFFRRHDLELGMFLCDQDSRPTLVLGFQGASPATLHAVLDPAVLNQHSVGLTDAEWVEDEVEHDYGLRKLSNYLKDPGLPLMQVVHTFREVFLGM
ncbi:MAG: type secretion system-associated protein TagF [Pseudomonadota bacterium]|jgi:type VI secretion system protein ImpM